jgi:hypothetical protein
MTRTERRKQYFDQAKQVAVATFNRERKAIAADKDAVYATNVSELSRAANQIGVIRNDRLVIPKGPIRKGMQVGMTQSTDYEGRSMTRSEREANRVEALKNSKPFSSTSRPLNAVHVAGHSGTRAHIDQRTPF